MSALIRYDAMVHAIAECHRVDEATDIRDKAMALESYARQAKNTAAERKACDIRLRAERRAGELLKDLARTPPQSAASAAGDSPYREALQQAQIPERTAQRYQELASVPAEQFESALRDPVRKPSTTRLINEARQRPALRARLVSL